VKAAFILCVALAATGVRPLRAQEPDGRALYMMHCRTCHGLTGKPTEFGRRAFARIPMLSDSAFIAARSQDSIVAVLTHGAGDGKDMASFKGRLTREQMVAVARYVRALPTTPSTSP
jgi:mono/diheme cytochrome c family protein